MSVITVERKVLEKNDLVAEENRKAFKERKTFTLNLVSSPGSGKTSLLERTALLSKERFNIGVIEGDVQTYLDAQRVDEYGVPVVQIITNGSCHLDAPLVRNAYNQFEEKDLNKIVEQMFSNYKFHLKNKNFQFNFSPKENLPKIKIDEEAVSEAMIITPKQR